MMHADNFFLSFHNSLRKYTAGCDLRCTLITFPQILENLGITRNSKSDYNATLWKIPKQLGLILADECFADNFHVALPNPLCCCAKCYVG